MSSSFVIQVPALQKESLLEDEGDCTSRLTAALKGKIQALSGAIFNPFKPRKPKAKSPRRRKPPAPIREDAPSLLSTIQALLEEEDSGHYASLYQCLQLLKATLQACYGLDAYIQFVPTEGGSQEANAIAIRHAGTFLSLQFAQDASGQLFDVAECPIAITKLEGQEPPSTTPSKKNKGTKGTPGKAKPTPTSTRRSFQDLQKQWDAKWFSMLDRLKKFKEEKGHANVPKDYIPDRSLGSWVSSQRTAYKEGKLKPERVKALEELGFVFCFRTIGKPQDMKEGAAAITDWQQPAVQRKWKAMLERLQTYKHQKGDTRVPSGYKGDPQLAYWVQNQRVLYKKDKLPQDRKDALEALGFLWRIYPEPSSTTTTNTTGTPRAATATTNSRGTKAEQDVKWYDLLERLKSFQREFGHTVVPQRYDRDLELGKWVQNQRRIEKEGKMKPQRKTLLDSLEFGWKVGTMGERTWQDNFDRLVEFKTKWGDCLVPTKYEPDQRLASWVMWQRGKYHQRKLPDENICKLDAIGFVWKVQRKGRRINHVSDVRGGYKHSSTFVVWSPSTSNEFWEAQLEKLKTYKAKFGHTNVPVVYFDDLQLAKWVTAQRMAYTKGQLSQERADKLQAIGFIWRLVRSWDDNFERLKEYHAKHGHCAVPADYPEDAKLGRWVKTQKAFSKRKELTLERLDKLMSIGFTWNAPKGTPKSAQAQSTAHSAAPAAPSVTVVDGSTTVAIYANETTAAAKPAPKTTPASGVTMPTDKNARLRANNARLSEDRRNLEAENRELRRKLREAEEANSWEDSFEQLQDYVAEHGNANVPTFGTKLGHWVAKMRDQYKRDVLDQERIALLEGVGFQWALKRGRRADDDNTPVQDPELSSPPKKKKRTVNAELLVEEEKLQKEKDKLAEAKRKLEEEKQKLRLRREALQAAKAMKKS